MMGISKLVKLTPKQREEYDKHCKWLEMASNCENIRDPPYVSIPTLLPNCAETNKSCRFEYCPKNEVQ